jgi:hypothetical protein
MTELPDLATEAQARWRRLKDALFILTEVIDVAADFDVTSLSVTGYPSHDGAAVIAVHMHEVTAASVVADRLQLPILKRDSLDDGRDHFVWQGNQDGFVLRVVALGDGVATDREDTGTTGGRDDSTATGGTLGTTGEAGAGDRGVHPDGGPEAGGNEPHGDPGGQGSGSADPEASGAGDRGLRGDRAPGADAPDGAGDDGDDEDPFDAAWSYEDGER